MAVTSSTVGTLYIVATPIGNRDDISHRALKTLTEVDAILAEDTRHSRQLLQGYGISKPLISLHTHNEGVKTESIINELLAGKTFALISDAGTPLINDPGFPLVKEARLNGVNVVPIPGACALITAISAAGIPCDVFTFAGFLPAKKSARKERLTELMSLPHTFIFYESTHRIDECLQDIAEVMGNPVEIVLAKELTKTFETFVTGTCAEIRTWLAEEAARSKGEFVLLIPPLNIKKENQAILDETKLLTTLLKELPLKQAVKIAVELSGGNKNELYKRALELSGKS